MESALWVRPCSFFSLASSLDNIFIFALHQQNYLLFMFEWRRTQTWISPFSNHYSVITRNLKLTFVLIIHIWLAIWIKPCNKMSLSWFRKWLTLCSSCKWKIIVIRHWVFRLFFQTVLRIFYFVSIFSSCLFIFVHSVWRVTSETSRTVQKNQCVLPFVVCL